MNLKNHWYLTLSWVRWIQFNTFNPIYQTSILISSCYLRLSLPSDLFRSEFVTKILCASHLSIFDRPSGRFIYSFPPKIFSKFVSSIIISFPHPNIWLPKCSTIGWNTYIKFCSRFFSLNNLQGKEGNQVKYRMTLRGQISCFIL